MSATDELRAMLDERGVEWTEGIARPELTQVRIDGKVVKFHPWQPNTLKVSLFDITPEQAVAATIGSCNCSNSERTNEACLPYWWTHDGTLHIEATRMPTRIVVCEGGTCEFVPKRELDASEAENAKLRELVRIAVKHCDSGTCDGCPIQGESGSCPYSDMARELGVEV